MRKHLSVSDIARMIDGDAEEGDRARIENHLAQCAACRERLVASVKESESLVRAFANVQLDTSHCPGDELLAAYIDDCLPLGGKAAIKKFLSPEETAAIEKHVSQCWACRFVVINAKYDEAQERKLQPVPGAEIVGG